jgi:hypothetical protein
MPRARTLAASLAGALTLLAFAGESSAQIIPLPPLGPQKPKPEPQPQPQPKPTPTPPPPDGSLSISVSRYDLNVGQTVRISGQLTGSSSGNSGKSVRLESQVIKPYRSRLNDTREQDTDSRGRYSFEVEPHANTRYVVSLANASNIKSAARRVYVFATGHLEIDYFAGGRMTRLNMYFHGGPEPPKASTGYAWFYGRTYGKRTFRRFARVRLRRCCAGDSDDIGWVRATTVMSTTKFGNRWFVRGCTKDNPIVGLGRGTQYRACGRPTLPA